MKTPDMGTPEQNKENAQKEQVSKDKTEKIRIIGTTMDSNFEGSIIIKTKGEDGKIIGYAIRKNEKGELEGNKIGYMDDSSVGWVQQLHESDFDKLREQGVLGSYERAFTVGESKKIDDANLLFLRLYMEGDKIDPTWGKVPEDSLMNPARKALEELSEEEQEKTASAFFNSTIGKNISNNKNAYHVYRHFKGTVFAKKFSQLEDERLKKAGYASGFTL